MCVCVSLSLSLTAFWLLINMLVLRMGHRQAPRWPSRRWKSAEAEGSWAWTAAIWTWDSTGYNEKVWYGWDVYWEYSPWHWFQFFCWSHSYYGWFRNFDLAMQCSSSSKHCQTKCEDGIFLGTDFLVPVNSKKVENHNFHWISQPTKRAFSIAMWVCHSPFFPPFLRFVLQRHDKGCAAAAQELGLGPGVR